MPMLGLTMEEGAVAEWLKREGEEVRKDEPLFTVEMDKGIVEVPSPASGVLHRVLVPVGETVAVKTVLAEIGAPGENAYAAPAEPGAAAVAPAANVKTEIHPVPNPLP